MLTTEIVEPELASAISQCDVSQPFFHDRR